MPKDRSKMDETLRVISIPQEQLDLLEDLKRVEKKLLRMKENYTDMEIPASVSRDLMEDFGFTSIRTMRALLRERCMHPEDCERVHNFITTIDELEHLAEDVVNVRVSMSKKSKIENSAFVITILVVVCTTIWGIVTIRSIPPEMRGAAFKTILEAAK